MKGKGTRNNELQAEILRLQKENEELKKRQITKNGFICDCEQNAKYKQALEEIRIQLCYSDNQYIFVVNFETAKCQWANKYHDKLDEALADMMSVLWQSLTDQEKEEIRRILNE